MPVALGYALGLCPNGPRATQSLFWAEQARQGQLQGNCVKKVVFLYQQKKVDLKTVSHQYQRL